MARIFHSSEADMLTRAAFEHDLVLRDDQVPWARRVVAEGVEQENSELDEKIFIYADAVVILFSFTACGIGKNFLDGKATKSRLCRYENFVKCTYASLRPISYAMGNDLEQLLKPTDSTRLDWDDRLTDANKRTRQGVKLSMREVRFIIEIWGLPLFLTVEEAATVASRSAPVLRNHVSEGRFPRSAIVGKPLMFVTTRFLQEVAARLERSK